MLWRTHVGPVADIKHPSHSALSSPSAFAALASEHLTKLNIKRSKGYCVSFVPLATEISSALNSP